MKRFLIIMQQNPYKNSLALEGLEFAMALSSFDQPVSLLFKNEGILQLLSKQDNERLIGKDFTKAYADLHLFGIYKIYVDQTSFHEFSAEELLASPQIVDAEQIVQLIKEHDVVVTL